MNQFDCNAMRVRNGWVAYFREVHRTANFVLRDGPHDIVFPTEAEAKEAARVAFLAYLNSPIAGLLPAADTKWDKANAVFNLEPTERPKFIKQRGKGRAIEVVREGARA